MKMFSFIFLVSTLLLSLINSNLNAQERDSLLFNDIIKSITSTQNKDKSIPDKIIITAKSRLNTPYVAGTLEQVPERLVVNIAETDCILFVESCLALALTSNLENPSFSNFKKILQELRYRDGVIDGYTSRLHYTSEWIDQAEESGILKEVTKSLGGVEFNENFSFISTHPELYKQISGNKKEIEKIKNCENNLNNYHYFYIPKDKIESTQSMLENGDFVCFNTSIDGLDISHIGIVYKDDNRVTFIHASLGGKKVLIEPGDIAQYVNKNSKTDGIRVVRVQNNR